MKTLIALASMAMLQTMAAGADQALAWPQFRGPGGSGVAEGQKPPVEFSPSKNVKWKVDVPSGLSSPIVAGDKLVLTAFDDGKLYTIAYSREDGKEAWRAEAPAQRIEGYFKAGGSPACSTCATDGERIVTYFGSCGLFCYDLAGKQLWKFEMPTAETTGDFGSGVSPILADGLVILVRDQTKDSKILALDAATGSLRWEQKRQFPGAYSTPVIWNTPAGKHIAVAGHAKMVGYDLKTGKEIWTYAGMPSGCCPSPSVGDGALFFAGWSPGGSEEPEFQMPAFDALLKDADPDKDQVITRVEAEPTFLKDFFDSNDANKDGKIVREEWDAVLKSMAEGTNSAFALKAGGAGDITNSHRLWKKTRGMAQVSTALLYRGQYVMVKDGGLVTAYDAKTGKEIFVQQRVAGTGTYFASPVAANGHIYLSSLDGIVTVLKAGADKPVVVAKNELAEPIAATPAFADDTLYLRTGKSLYAFAEKN